MFDSRDNRNKDCKKSLTVKKFCVHFVKICIKLMLKRRVRKEISDSHSKILKLNSFNDIMKTKL